MAISLSELTGASTSGNVLNEVNSYADFLDSVPRLVNKADPTGATDAVQTVATKQPVALPLIDGEGYCYLPSVAGNYVSTPDSSELDITGDITIECDFIVPEFPLSATKALVAKYNTVTNSRSYQLVLDSNGTVSLVISQDGTYNPNFSKGRDFSSVLSSKTRATVKATWRQSDGLTQFFIKESDGSFTQVSGDHTIAATSIYNGNQEVEIGSTNSGSGNFGSSIGVFGARIYASVDGTDKRLDIDFTSPRIPHGATEFTCETGQVVTVNTSGNNPSKVIKKPVLRFDGNDDSFKGFFANQLNGGYMFAAFTVLGGGDWGRVFSINKTGGANDYTDGGVLFSYRDSNTPNLLSYKGGASFLHSDLYRSENGDILHEVSHSETTSLSKVNSAGELTATLSYNIEGDEFNIASGATTGVEVSCIDLEYLALFPATLTDSQADQVRSFINNRNKVFYRWDTDGYYFFDGAATDDGQVFTGSGSWNGRIVGSDNGDSDFYISQNTLDDRPTTDGYKITFADNTDHFDIPSTTQAGWQIVGTSLGTFAYKVDSDAITELNLLGNAAVGDGFNFRSVGDLYGIILLPQNATNRDIEEARKLLIDRGASDGASVSSFYAAWYKRRDVVEFRATMPQATDFRYAWKECTSLTSFSTQLPEVTNAQEAWYNNASLSSFTTTDLKNCSNFSGAWQFCTSLTQFPQDAKLGTEATNVNFQSAWQQSGLTSFPALDLSKGNNFNSAWKLCSSLQSFPEDAKLGTEVAEGASVEFSSAWRSSGLTSFSTPLPTATGLTACWRDSNLTSFNLSSLPRATTVSQAFWGTRLTSFSTELPICTGAFAAWYDIGELTNFNLNSLPSVTDARYSWYNTGLISFHTKLPKCGEFTRAWTYASDLVDFSADVFADWNPVVTIKNSVFHEAWTGCTSLTAQSVENILVPIAASGKWATDDGTSGGTALTDATIDIDYDVSTGSLTAATLTAIETLNGRGWSVNINGVIQ